VSLCEYSYSTEDAADGESFPRRDEFSELVSNVRKERTKRTAA
jgi:hypothetical protein